MRKLTKTVVEKLKKDANNIVFEKDEFIKILAQNGDVVIDWVNEKTLKFAVDNYEELDKACDNFYRELVEKKYKGSALEKIAKVEAEYSDHDKAILASVNMDKLMRF